jgi:hypothetical protein
MFRKKPKSKVIIKGYLVQKFGKKGAKQIWKTLVKEKKRKKKDRKRSLGE